MAVTRTGTVQINVKVGGTEEAKAAQDAIDKMEQHLGKLGATMAAGAQKMNAWGFALANNVIASIPGLLSKVGGAIVDVAKDLEQFDLMSKRFKGSVDDVEKALRFGVDEVVFMQAQFKLSNVGLHITGQAFTDLGTSATKLAHAMGVDVKEAFESVTQLLVTGSAKQAKALGLMIDTEKVERDYARALGGTVEQLTEMAKQRAHQEAYLEAIKKKTADMVVPVETGTDRWNKLKDTVVDATRDMLRATKTWAGETAYLLGEMGDELAHLWRRTGTQPGTEGYEGTGGLGVAAATAVRDKSFAEMDEAVRALDPKPKARGGTPADSPFAVIPSVWDQYGDSAVPESDLLKKGKAKKGAMRADDGSPAGLLGGAFSMAMTMENEWQEQAAKIEKTNEAYRKMRKATVADEIAGLQNEATVLRQVRDLNKAAGIKEHAKAIEQANNPLKALIQSHYGLTKAIRLEGQAFEEWNKQFKASIASGLLDTAISSMSNLAGGIWQAADAAIQGGESFGAAMLKMAKTTLLGIASQATIQAVFQMAEGFAKLAMTWGIPNPGATAHFTAAGIYAGVAAVTGAAGLGISAATAPSHGAPSHGVGGGGMGSGAVAPRATYGISKSDDSQRPIYVSLYLTPGDPAATALANRQLEAKIRKAAA